MAGIVGLTELQHTNGNSMLTVATTGDGNVKSEGGAATTSLRQGLTKAWTNLNGTGTIAIQDSFNTSSATDRNTGRYEFNRTNNMVNILYTCSGSNSQYAANGSSVYVSDSFYDYQTQGPFSTSASTSGVYESSFVDAAYVSNNVHGDLA
tara:strand:- start:544 stop:993 length:450 start_codon:yes stop_codon:yes gene_type:complete